ncbi:MAG: glutamate-5-semialdehyde dehydrogenase [Myxococcota bacterium]|jgi:glutamate-5-semialdehyde dehydrogenase
MSTVPSICRAARDAQPRLAAASPETRNAVLEHVARLLVERTESLVAENQKDLAAAEASDLSSAMVDRLRLTPDRIQSIAQGVREIIALPDPVGGIEDLKRRPNGLQVGRMRIPLGVIAMIFESRPNVVIDAGALCLKSSNAVILKGGKEALHSNIALAAVLRDALEAEGLPPEAMALLTDRADVAELLKQSDTVDLLIPRGGKNLIRYVTDNSSIPVVQHFEGICHAFVDESADLTMASDITLNAKAQRPGVCNALETLLVHVKVAPAFLPGVTARLEDAGVEVRGCVRSRSIVPSMTAATDEDWATEYIDLILSVRVVDDMEAALEHIHRFGSDHTETIITSDYARANAFVARVPSSAVMVNASTRFNDGGQLGLGAEIGISTSRLHAFGPMGLQELTTRKWVVFGSGQIRQ